MITAVIVAPYTDIKKRIDHTLQEYVPSEPMKTQVVVMTAGDVAEATFDSDVIIARGFSAELLKRRSTQPVVPLQVSAYDVIEAVSLAIARHSPTRIALVGLRETVGMAERTSRLFPAVIRSFPATDIQSLPGVIEEARNEGCDCFVGGLELNTVCGRLGLDSVLLRTGMPAIVSSLEEAVRVVRSTREQRAKSLSLQAILDHTREGVVSLDENGRVNSINSTALRYLERDDAESCLGRPVGEVMPFRFEGQSNVFAGAQRLENEIVTHGDRVFALDRVPLGCGREAAGCVIFLRNIHQVQDEESLLRRKIQSRGHKAKYRMEDIVGKSPAIRRAIEKAELYARVDSPVLIVGESGTGKELFAQGIHTSGGRRDGPFIAINCAALSETLLESELFGYSDGAFTGALKGGKEGVFEAAHGGTLFLDEISEVPVSFQSKLLRVLQEGEVRRLGSQRVIPVDVRIISATNRNLEERVRQNLFRQDLLFRLNVLYLHLQPLRRRPEDMMELFRIHMRKYAKRGGGEQAVITGGAWEELAAHSWFGNVRELKNIVERICVLRQGGVVDKRMVADALRGGEGEEKGIAISDQAADLEADEVVHLRSLLLRHGGNRGKVAESLGVDRSTVWRKMKKHGLL